MSITFIPGDGGSLPTPVSAPTASALLADYLALSTEDKAAFRLAIAPAHHTLTGEAVTSGASDAVAGDTAHDTEDDGPLWRLQRNAPESDKAWIDIIGDTAAPENTEATADPGIPVPGGMMPGQSALGRLAAVWAELSPAQRAAFRAEIKPQFSNVADQTARLALTNQVPGDYARQTATGLFRLKALPASNNANWDLIHPF